MQKVFKLLISISLTTLGFYPCLSQADGLSDLITTLNRLQGTNNISAELESVTLDTKGEDDKKIFAHGEVKVLLEDDELGLRVLYSNDALQKMEDDAGQIIKDEEADTRTLNAIDEINASELHSMLSASASLLRDINQAEYLNEKNTILNGINTRLLRFKLPMEFFISDKKVRSYVSKFAAEYLVWISSDGTPLESRIEFSGKGRVFIFFKIAVTGAAFSRYQVHGNRLLAIYKEGSYLNDTSLGVFEHSEVKTLHILNPR